MFYFSQVCRVWGGEMGHCLVSRRSVDANINVISFFVMYRNRGYNCHHAPWLLSSPLPHKEICSLCWMILIHSRYSIKLLEIFIQPTVGILIFVRQANDNGPRFSCFGYNVRGMKYCNVMYQFCVLFDTHSGLQRLGRKNEALSSELKVCPSRRFDFSNSDAKI